MARLMGTSMLGSSAAQIVIGMEAAGLSARKVQVADSDHEGLSPPAMLFVDNPFTGPESHAVALLEIEEGRALIWDPLTGAMMDLSKEESRRFWRGRAIEFRNDEE